MALTLLALAALLLAAGPALLFRANLLAYRPPPAPPPGGPIPQISVLIPARDEAQTIARSVAAALASRGVAVEVVVLDDHSEDETASILAVLAAHDPRLRPIAGPELPPGWCGKQHACARLAEAAHHPLLVFLDADVRLAPDGLARIAAFLDASGADLASGIPHQETEGLVERLVIPLIHFILLGFLPIRRMRSNGHPAYAAGCGQLFITRRDAYEQAGGHAAIRASRHDGIKLPRAYRHAGLRTDLFDATAVASCRMYHGAGALWRGLAKNAGEALAAPALILPATLLLAGGQILPFALLSCAPLLPRPGLVLSVLAVCAASYPRLVAASRFRQSFLGALLHPVSVALLLAIQWWAFARNTLGWPTTWKGRPYPAPGAGPGSDTDRGTPIANDFPTIPPEVSRYLRSSRMPRPIHTIALILAIVGALNWGLWGLFQFDLVAALFGGATAAASRIVYSLVGLAGAVLILTSLVPTGDVRLGSQRTTV